MSKTCLRVRFLTSLVYLFLLPSLSLSLSLSYSVQFWFLFHFVVFLMYLKWKLQTTRRGSVASRRAAGRVSFAAINCRPALGISISSSV